MKPVNWNDPDLVGKKIICKTNKQIYLVKYVFEGGCYAVLKDEEGFECSMGIGRADIWYYYEEPEEGMVNKCFQCGNCNNRFVIYNYKENLSWICENCGSEKLTPLKEVEEVTNPILKGPVPEGKETASGLRDKKLLAPALIRHYSPSMECHGEKFDESYGVYKVSENFYSSKEEAIKSLESYKNELGSTYKVICWPAPLPNKDGFYEVSD